jgi:hypothetical protein
MKKRCEIGGTANKSMKKKGRTKKSLWCAIDLLFSLFCSPFLNLDIPIPLISMLWLGQDKKQAENNRKPKRKQIITDSRQ